MICHGALFDGRGNPAPCWAPLETIGFRVTTGTAPLGTPNLLFARATASARVTSARP